MTTLIKSMGIENKKKGTDNTQSYYRTKYTVVLSSLHDTLSTPGRGGCLKMKALMSYTKRRQPRTRKRKTHEQQYISSHAFAGRIAFP